MKVMYIQYKKGTQDSIIKDGENIIMSSKRISPLTNREKNNEPIYTHASAANKIIPLSDLDYKIDEEITNFFFDAIHKNYLRKQKTPYKMT